MCTPYSFQAEALRSIQSMPALPWNRGYAGVQTAGGLGKAITAPPGTYTIEATPPIPTRAWKVPRSLIVGILAQETESTLTAYDAVNWVNRIRGKDGERGPTQITPGAFADNAKPGERFADLEKDMSFALDMTERILLDHRAKLGSWAKAVKAYNAGRGNWRSKAAASYHADVVRKGGG